MVIASSSAVGSCARSSPIWHSYRVRVVRSMASSMRCGRKPNAEAQCRPTRARPCTRTPRGPAEVSDLIRWSLADGGYALLVAPLDVDVRRFESLVHSAADPGCSVARRIQLLEEGLALWNGAALGGLHDREWARPGPRCGSRRCERSPRTIAVRRCWRWAMRWPRCRYSRQRRPPARCVSEPMRC